MYTAAKFKSKKLLSECCHLNIVLNILSNYLMSFYALKYFIIYAIIYIDN